MNRRRQINKKWIRRHHVINAFAAILFILALVGTQPLSRPEQEGNLVLSKPRYKIIITKYPFSLKVEDSKNNQIDMGQLALVDELGHFIPLSNFASTKSRLAKNHPDDETYESSKDSYSFIISSHIRKDLLYQATLHTKTDELKVSLLPLNEVSKKYTQDKMLKITIKNKSMIKENSRIVANKTENYIFSSKFFEMHGIKDKMPRFSVFKFHDHLTLSSQNNEMFFSLNFNKIPRNAAEKVSYKMEDPTKNL